MVKKISVQTYSGYRLDERPIRFFSGKRMHEIQEVLNRTEEEILPTSERIFHFRVRCKNGKIYSLMHSPDRNQWYLVSGNNTRPH